jgi:hypothetical protein
MLPPDGLRLGVGLYSPASNKIWALWLKLTAARKIRRHETSSAVRTDEAQTANAASCRSRIPAHQVSGAP